MWALLKQNSVWSRISKDTLAYLTVSAAELVQPETDKDKKVKVPDLSFVEVVRWYQHMMEMPACVGATDELSLFYKTNASKMKSPSLVAKNDKKSKADGKTKMTKSELRLD